MARMPRIARAALVCALVCALAPIAQNLLAQTGWGAALRSVFDRLLPNPQVTMWAPSPDPDSFTAAYADATGAGENYVYLVDAADGRVGVRELQLIFFGGKPDGEGWLEIEARGGSGVRYRSCADSDVPPAALGALASGRDLP